MSLAFTAQEVAQNNGQNGKPVWMIIKGKVYDVTPYLDSVSLMLYSNIGTYSFLFFISQHPGGSELLMEYAGKDATNAFRKAGHSVDAIRELKQFYVGDLLPVQIDIKAPQISEKVRGMDECTKQKKRIKLFFCF